MAAEVTSLSLNVKSDSVTKGATRLDKLTVSATKAEHSTNKFNNTATKGATAVKGATAATKAMSTATTGLGMSLKSALAPLLAMLGPMLAVKKLFSSTVEIQDYRAQLKTATGSVQAAADAFERLEGFASETPYQLEQSLEAFIKLKNLGLDPSQKALRSYGNTASAMGKDLTQLIEAVADATTGEFERLKEFGIKAKSEGDKVSFTFRGVTKTIGKNAEEIQQYLMAIGETEFAGAMAARMDTLGGKVSNLGDLWNRLFREVSEMGVGNVIGEGIEYAIKALEEMIAIVASGQFQNELRSWTVGFQEWGRAFAETLDIINSVLGDNQDKTKSWLDEFLYGVKILPSFIHLLIKTFGELTIAIGAASLELVAIFDTLKTAGTRSITETRRIVVGSIEAMKASFTEMGRATRENIESWDRETARVKVFSQNAKSAREEYDKMIASKRRNAEMDNLLGSIYEEVTGESPDSRKATTDAQENNLISGDVSYEKKKTQTLTSEYEQRLEIKRGYSEKFMEMEFSIIEAERQAQEEREMLATRRAASTASLFQALASLENSRNEKAQRRSKALGIAAATINTYTGASQALKEEGVGTYVKFANAAAIIATGLAQVQNIREAGNYATGGIVPGSSYSGDSMTANVNSGEAILTRTQQARLFALANGAGNTTTSNTGSVALNVTVENYGSSEITVERMSETDVRIIARDVVREEAPAVIAADMSNPNSRTSNALSRNTNAQRRRN